MMNHNLTPNAFISKPPESNFIPPNKVPTDPVKRAYSLSGSFWIKKGRMISQQAYQWGFSDLQCEISKSGRIDVWVTLLRPNVPGFHFKLTKEPGTKFGTIEGEPVEGKFQPYSASYAIQTDYLASPKSKHGLYSRYSKVLGTFESLREKQVLDLITSFFENRNREQLLDNWFDMVSSIEKIYPKLGVPKNN